MLETESGTREVQQLRRCIRDLVALSAFPAVCVGYAPLRIAESLADVLRHMLNLEFLYLAASRAFLVLAALCSAHSFSQGWPNRPLHYIVPFPPGAFNDTLARTLSAELPKTLGQPVIVENRPGAGGNIATEYVAK